MYRFVKIFFLKSILLLMVFIGEIEVAFAQPPKCVGPGSTPSKAILVCGNKPFTQNMISACEGGTVYVPSFCNNNNPFSTDPFYYKIYAPVYYKIKCYESGTLGFLISPFNTNQVLHWQVYDITGKDPEQYIYNSADLSVAGFWSRAKGFKGASSSGTPWYQCYPPDPPAGPLPDYPHFGAMPMLIKGHEYLLLISTFDSSSPMEGFTLNFEGGTAVISDPIEPKMETAKGECVGNEITIKLNKPVNCNSLTTTGSEFKILPAVASVVSAAAVNCTNATQEITLKLSALLTDGNYKLIINKGSDGNTLLDICDNPIPDNSDITFDFVTPQPILADSIGKTSCTPDSVKLYFPKKISCASISANGSDFSINGPQILTITNARGKCVNGKTEYVSIKFDKQITTKGIYHLTLKGGDDGSPIVDECGLPTVLQTIDFTVADTVNADFTYTTKFGCQRDTLSFSHDAAHDVNNWKWIFNKIVATTQTPTIIFPAKSTNDVKLFVSNGTCIDSAVATIKLDNEVKAAFTMTDIICPEDKLEVLNETTGTVDQWRWNYDIIGTATAKDPQPFLFPTINKEAYYSVKLVAYNNTFNCSDSIRKTLTVLDHCLIGVATGFTPNNDGLNDYFSPHNALKADNLVFKVFSRYGQLIFQSKTWRDKWDGKMNGVLQPTGVYVWMLSYINSDTKKAVFQRGTVTLIR